MIWDEVSIRERWREHFEQLFGENVEKVSENRKHDMMGESINNAEVLRAMKMLKNDVDGVTSECLGVISTNIRTSFGDLQATYISVYHLETCRQRIYPYSAWRPASNVYIRIVLGDLQRPAGNVYIRIPFGDLQAAYISVYHLETCRKRIYPCTLGDLQVTYISVYHLETCRQQNQEKLYLYLTVSVSGGLLLFLGLVIGRLLVQRHRARDEAKFHATTAPERALPNGFADDISEIDADIDLTTPVPVIAVHSPPASVSEVVERSDVIKVPPYLVVPGGREVVERSDVLTAPPSLVVPGGREVRRANSFPISCGSRWLDLAQGRQARSGEDSLRATQVPLPLHRNHPWSSPPLLPPPTPGAAVSVQALEPTASSSAKYSPTSHLAHPCEVRVDTLTRDTWTVA
uniref:Uncharacterized protein n=1 Tax=Timema shepardi TaxID=629360 RepID=A0A7R9AZ50_TIMSH|nr:unnamed protein product [Timema shepardi]